MKLLRISDASPNRRVARLRPLPNARGLRQRCQVNMSTIEATNQSSPRTGTQRDQIFTVGRHGHCVDSVAVVRVKERLGGHPAFNVPHNHHRVGGALIAADQPAPIRTNLDGFDAIRLEIGLSG